MIAKTVSGILFALSAAVIPATAAVADTRHRDTKHPMSGIASIYAYGGEKTASGQMARPHELTAAHRTLPFGTRVRVTHKKNGRSVVVRINDRGPFIKGRVIDLTPRAAASLGFSGLAPVDLRVEN